MVLYQSQGRTQMAEQVADKLHQHRLKIPIIWRVWLSERCRLKITAAL